MKNPVTRPSVILAIAASGLPSFRAVSSATRRSLSTRSVGTSSRFKYCGENAAICCAISLPVSGFAFVSATTTPTCGGRSGLVRCKYNPTGEPSRTARRRSSIFSPRVALASSICSCTVLPEANFEAEKPATSLILVAKSCSNNSLAAAWKRSPFATKSVSQLSSSITAVLPSAFATTKPLEVVRPSRLVMPF
ncbi:unannotated protein [freshwater metagenome]|uniref:Unannotated protein n=1 Tax=freshwater metagenome TaxID=449393 RepID=A0A6J7UC75_9ZZZZ